MNIAMIGHKRIPGREGGVEVVVEELSTRLVKRQQRVTAFNRKKKGYLERNEYKGVKIVTVPTIERKNTDAVVYSFLASIRVAFGNYDIIHYHAIGPSFFLFIPRLFRKKIIVTVHGLNYKTPKWKGIGATFIKMGERMVAKYADSIIVLSKEQKKYFKEKYNRDTDFIPNGTVCNDVAKASEIKKQYNLTHDGYILFVSRIVPGKGLEYLLDAYKNIEGNIPLVVAGDTEYVFEFKKMIEDKAKNDDRVKLIGFAEGDLLKELYSNAKFFVFPSEAEGMPMCLLEALSYNCKCIVSNIPENIEVGKEYVRTFESKNVDDLRETIKECLENPSCFKSGSREYIKDNYSWDVVVDKTISLYNKTIEKK